ncbi:hypothetical protein [Telluribacter sp.]|jgi:hypothetical protein|uniref:hypothetical protein n=1 Tax=Telluribacter sp. TaxID=1978767 RepID=UPI002E1477EE|nr:hypothetical protein [Telluribacter sp.]
MKNNSYAEYKSEQIEIDPKTGIPFKVWPWTKKGELSLHASSEDTKKYSKRIFPENIFKHILGKETD